MRRSAPRTGARNGAPFAVAATRSTRDPVRASSAGTEAGSSALRLCGAQRPLGFVPFGLAEVPELGRRGIHGGKQGGGGQPAFPERDDTDESDGRERGRGQHLLMGET